jgi:hypothetical protein
MWTARRCMCSDIWHVLYFNSYVSARTSLAVLESVCCLSPPSAHSAQVRGTVAWLSQSLSRVLRWIDFSPEVLLPVWTELRKESTLKEDLWFVCNFVFGHFVFVYKNFKYKYYETVNHCTSECNATKNPWLNAVLKLDPFTFPSFTAEFYEEEGIRNFQVCNVALRCVPQLL